MKILDGRKLSEKILLRLKKEIKKKRLKLKLAVILIGNNPVSQVYIREKKRACRKVGVDFELFQFSSDIKQQDLEEAVREIAADPANSGIVVQLPLPDTINSQEILDLIPLQKDVDVLSSASINSFSSLMILPPVVCAVKKLLEEYRISLKGKKIVLIGKGRLVGKPLSIWLKNIGADFSIVDRNTKNISDITQSSDIIISGTGKSKIITAHMVKEGAVIIDAGTSCDSCGLGGDVDFENVSKKASYITPVPGGVGPMTVACLLENLVNIWTYTFSTK